MVEQRKAFSGRARRMTTRRRVVLADWTARTLISAGGIGTIVAVTGVFVFLLWVVVPLFREASAELRAEYRAGPSGEAAPLHVGSDEYRVLGWALAPDGQVTVFRLDDGSVRARVRVFEPGELRSISAPSTGEQWAFGLSDGSVCLGRLGFQAEFLRADALEPELLQRLESAPGEAFDLRDGVVQWTGGSQARLQSFVAEIGDREPVSGLPIVAVDHVDGAQGPFVVALASDGERFELFAVPSREDEDFLTGETVFAFQDAVPLPYDVPTRGAPAFVAVSGSGGDVYLAWEDGALLRVNCQDLADPFVAERVRLVEKRARLTELGLVLGESTLVWGDSEGRVAAGFLVPASDLAGETLFDPWRSERARFALVRAKDLPDAASAVISLAPSARSRIVAYGSRAGRVVVANVTTQDRLCQFDLPGGVPVQALSLAPKEDAIVATSGERVFVYDLDPQHAEASPAALFSPIWYEGYPRPEHTWQSSSGHTGFEPKLGLVPLIVGTIKATLYSMLFGAPLALLAALYSSEFLKPRVKAVVKPTVELMASLPSVVLGFLAALVIAPFVERTLPGVLAAFLCLPVAFLVAAYLWQLLPGHVALRLSSVRLLFFLVPTALGCLAAALLGPAFEQLLFRGDLRGWCGWVPGRSDPGSPFASSVGGWFVLLLPLGAVCAALLLHRTLGPWMRRLSRGRERSQMAVLDLGRFAAGAALTVLLALGSGWLLDGFGFDPRGGLSIGGIDLSPVGTYVQRNSLVVGFVMGFAIIPIIYTIADDALSSVPGHLRSASLGAGATQWQTATRIVVPTAMSGLFSALMIGLGRAVGETMIVLMATGNTPILDFNVFSGFRTLSANIAVELPEAVKDSTHYRTLFLAALVLFVMTFLVNTAAEIVRLRFRRRSYQL